MRGKMPGNVIWNKTGCMESSGGNEAVNVRVATAARLVIASEPVLIARYCLLLLAFAASTSCLPSKPAPKGDKSKDNDLAFRPTDLSFRRPYAPSKASADTGTAPAASAHLQLPVLRPDRAPLNQPFSDHFDTATLSSDWRATSTVWHIENGRLCGRGAHNHPVWLQRRIPKNARITFTAESDSVEGDIKVEIWGDGQSEAKTISYTNATSYLFILGGWKNHFHVLARIDEHAPDRLERRVSPEATDPRDRPVVPGVKYRFGIERADGRTVRWTVDGAEMAKLNDPMPLVGPGHEYLGFNNWEVRACFDDLNIVPLPD